MPFPHLILALAAAAPQALQGAAARGPATPTQKVERLELVGLPTAGAPHFRFVRAVQVGQDVRVAVDPARLPQLVGVPVNVHVVAAKDAAQWAADATLVDVTGGATPLTLQAGTIGDNVVTVDAGTLGAGAGPALGAGYDVVLDVDGDGRLSAGDAIDGAGDATGFWVLPDLTQPGPFAVTEAIYSGGTFLGQDLYHPTNVASLGSLPLVVISHGNGHDYRWYDHLGEHLASWGCVVMSHQNNTQPGPESASVTTLSNTEYLLANLATIQGGVLDGHVDAGRIAWIGHSRGGEGVVRAYDKLVDGTYVPVNFTPDAVRLVSSIAPTQFLLSDLITPHEVTYHLFVGAADTDVNGGPSSPIAQSIPIFERGQGAKLCQSVQGAGHADFHNQATNCFCFGPDLIGKAGTHPVMKAYYLALVKHTLEESEATLDVLERPFDDLAPIGVPSNVVVANDHRVALDAPRLVIDDFQTEPDMAVASSGAAVVSDVYNLDEGRMIDLDGSFVVTANTPLNGMTRARDAGDDPRCGVFDWDGFLGPQSFEYQLLPAQRDLSGYQALGFRACQITRHPQTDNLDAPVSFGVTLVDGNGTTSTLPTSVYGTITRPYERFGAGTGAGWANEMVGLRLRLVEFTHAAPLLDLSDVRALRFDFDAAFGDERGRIGLDDVEFLPAEDAP